MAKTPTKKNVTKTSKKKEAAPAPSVTEPVRPAPVGHIDASVLDRLYAVVASRRDTDPSISHSARLLARGTGKVAQKFGEEAVECLIEAVAGRKLELVGESADVLYHLIVLWVDAGVTPDEVWSELQRRQGISGIAEKASRPKQ
ncbi:MAG: phosphoribosyl-ATP diphosphatase [Acetobacter sp.]